MAGRARIGAALFEVALQPHVGEQRAEMVGPVADFGRDARQPVLQLAVDEGAERNAGDVVVGVAALDEIHRHIERPVEIGLVAEPRLEGERQVAGTVAVGVAPDLGAGGEEARQLAKKIEGVPCTIPVNVGEEDKLFGSVTSQEIADFLKKEGIEIEKRDIELEEPIKQLGVYSVKIGLYKDVSAKLKVWVVKDEQK